MAQEQNITLSSPNPEIRIMHLNEAGGAATLREDIRLVVDSDQQPFSNKSLYGEAGDAALYHEEDDYITSQVITPFLDANQSDYSNILTLWKEPGAEVGKPGIHEILALASNIVWQSSGDHLDGINAGNRGTLENNLAYPARPEHTNCLAFNESYLRVFNVLLGKLNPELAQSYRLVVATTNFAPDVARLYHKYGSGKIDWNQPHANLIMLSGARDGATAVTVIDPYHLKDELQGKMKPEQTDGLDFTERRGIEGLVCGALYELRAVNRGGGYLSPKHGEVIRSVLQNVDLDSLKNSDTKMDQILSWQLSSLLIFLYDETYRAFNRGLRIAGKQIESVSGSVDSRLGVPIESFKTVLELKRKFGGISGTDMLDSALQEHLQRITATTTRIMQEVETAVHDLKTVYNESLGLSGLLTDLSENGLAKIESAVAADQPIEPEILQSAFDTFSVQALTGYLRPKQLARFTEVIRKMKGNNIYASFRRWLRITMSINQIVVPEDMVEPVFDQWLELNRGVAELIRDEQGNLPEIRIANRPPNAKSEALQAVYINH